MFTSKKLVQESSSHLYYDAKKGGAISLHITQTEPCQLRYLKHMTIMVL